MVGSNVNLVTMACEFFFSFFNIRLYLTDKSLHAGVSTVTPACNAIPFSAFANTVEEYEADSAMDDEGDMINA